MHNESRNVIKFAFLDTRLICVLRYGLRLHRQGLHHNTHGRSDYQTSFNNIAALTRHDIAAQTTMHSHNGVIK